MYYGNIDVSKIDKTKIYKGQKGSYLPIVVWINDEPDQFGNSMSVIQGQTKEEREAGGQKVYLGNLKENNPEAKPTQQEKPVETNDLPF